MSIGAKSLILWKYLRYLVIVLCALWTILLSWLNKPSHNFLAFTTSIIILKIYVAPIILKNIAKKRALWQAMVWTIGLEKYCILSNTAAKPKHPIPLKYIIVIPIIVRALWGWFLRFLSRKNWLHNFINAGIIVRKVTQCKPNKTTIAVKVNSVYLYINDV